MREIASVLGLGLVIWSIVTYTDLTVFPGAAALAPCLGAALIIYGGTTPANGGAALVNQLLGAQPFRFIGLISYSLYLWHWPLWVFANYEATDGLSILGQAAWLAATFAFSILSWRYVETPFRKRQVCGRRWQIYATGGVFASIGAAIGFYLYATDGRADRFDRQVLEIEAAAADSSPVRWKCHAGRNQLLSLEESCVYGADVEPRYALWGDSHGIELAYRIGDVAKRHDASLIQFTFNACPPAYGLDAHYAPGCKERNDQVFAWLRDHETVETVLIVAQYGKSDYMNDADAFFAGIRASIDGLAESGKNVALVYPYPTYELPVPRVLAQLARRGESLDEFSTPREDFDERHARAFAFLDSIANDRIVGRYYPHTILCDDELCRTFKDGEVLYFDEDHMSHTAAARAAELFDPLFTDVSRCGEDGGCTARKVSAGETKFASAGASGDDNPMP